MKAKNIFLGAVLVLVGLLMVIMPGTCTKAVVVLLGIAAVANGIYNLVLMNRNSFGDFIRKSVLIKSISSIVIGLVAIVFPFALIKTGEIIWKVINYVLAVYFLLFAALGFFVAAKSREFPEERKRASTEAFVSLLIAILLFIIPVESIGKAFFVIIGIASIAIGTALIVMEILVRKRISVVKDAVVTDDVEAENSGESSGSDGDSE